MTRLFKHNSPHFAFVCVFECITAKVDILNTFCHVVYAFVLECNIERGQVQKRHIFFKSILLAIVYLYLYLNVLQR